MGLDPVYAHWPEKGLPLMGLEQRNDDIAWFGVIYVELAGVLYWQVTDMGLEKWARRRRI